MVGAAARVLCGLLRTFDGTHLLLALGRLVRRTGLVSIISSSWRPCSRMLMILDTVSKTCTRVVSAASQWDTLNGTLFRVEPLPVGRVCRMLLCYIIVLKISRNEGANPISGRGTISSLVSHSYAAVRMKPFSFFNCSLGRHICRLLCLNILTATRTRDRTADVSALKRSVPREQGSRIRHSRPEDSAAPACRLHTAMSEVVGSERSEGGDSGWCWWWPKRRCIHPWHPRCSSALVAQGPIPFALHAAVTPHARWPSCATSWAMDGWLADCGVSILSATLVGLLRLLLGGDKVQCDTLSRSEIHVLGRCLQAEGGPLMLPIPGPPSASLSFEAGGVETPCGTWEGCYLGEDSVISRGVCLGFA